VEHGTELLWRLPPDGRPSHAASRGLKLREAFFMIE